MGSSRIVELEVSPESSPGFRNRFIRPQVNLLVFDASPEPLDEHAISPAPPPVHADLDSALLQQAGKCLACELAPLVRVEDLWSTIAFQRFFNRLYAEGCVHRDRNPPGQHLTTEPVHYSGEVHEPLGHWYVRDVHGPCLVWSGYREDA